MLSTIHIKYYVGFFSPCRCWCYVYSVFSFHTAQCTLYLSFHSFRIVVNSRINLPKYGYLNEKKNERNLWALKRFFCVQTEMRRKVNELLLYKCVCDSISTRNICTIHWQKENCESNRKKNSFCRCFMFHVKAHKTYRIVSIKTIQQRIYASIKIPLQKERRAKSKPKKSSEGSKGQTYK